MFKLIWGVLIAGCQNTGKISIPREEASVVMNNDGDGYTIGED